MKTIFFGIIFAVSLLFFASKNTFAQSPCSMAGKTCNSNLVCSDGTPNCDNYRCNIATASALGTCIYDVNFSQSPHPPCSKGLSDPNNPTSETTDKKLIKKCTQFDTGLGIPIGTDPSGFVKTFFGIILSLSGGIALLLIIISGYQLMFSQGNPEKTQGAKETLTSTIVGLLFIIFSLVILQVVGVDILKIPGFR